MAKGTLFLIPVPLAENANKASYTLLHHDIINQVTEYIVENEKTARKFLKEAGIKTPQSDLVIHDYGKYAREKINYNQLFASLFKGKDMGLMSEAGCPGVADPGADVVHQAHKHGIKVVPLVGPSSILLAQMASGFNGQLFSFLGYLPIDKSARAKAIKDLEFRSAKEKSSQIFIETPFRNNQLLGDILKQAKDHTQLCIACNLTGEQEYIATKTIAQWKETTLDLHKKPCIFLLYAL